MKETIRTVAAVLSVVLQTAAVVLSSIVLYLLLHP